MKKKLLLAFLCLLLASMMVLACACDKDKKDETQTTASTDDEETGDTSLYADLPTDKINRELTALSPNEYLSSWVQEGMDGDPISEIVYERTLEFEEKYDAVINTIMTDSWYDNLSNAYLGGGGVYDLLYPHPQGAIVTAMTSGMLTNLTELNTLSLDSPWYNQSQVQNYKTNNKLYLAVSDSSITGQGFFALVYNRDLYQTLGYEENIHTLVMDGEWTMEKFAQMLAETASFADGTEDQTYGLCFNELATARWLYAGGETILVKNEDTGLFSKGLNSNNMVKIATNLYNIVYNSGNTVSDSYPNSGIPTSKVWLTFNAGRGLFATWDVGSCYSYLREVSFKRGYAPLPKVDEDQSDYKVVCASAFYAIPALSENAEESALLLEYFSIYGYEKIKPAFFTTILGGRLSGDPEDYEMLEFLHSKKFFDFGFTLDSESEVLNLLKTSVVTNKAPGGIAVLLATNVNTIKNLVDTANQID
ncbi:MAG: hypothetical protein IJW55_00235 [Clostridia bacterium]|nr:hypothetical protein [Clostridia bacterium]